MGINVKKTLLGITEYFYKPMFATDKLIKHFPDFFFFPTRFVNMAFFFFNLSFALLGLISIDTLFSAINFAASVCYTWWPINCKK